MNKLILLFSAAFLFSCTAPTSYVIEGKLPVPNFDGQNVYMTDLETSVLLDSALVSDRQFAFKGKADSASLCQLVLGDDLFAIIVKENGRIKVQLSNQGSATGTPLNDKLNAFFTTENQILAQWQASCDSIMPQGAPQDNEKLKILEALTDQAIEKVFTLMEETVKANPDNVVGLFALWDAAQQMQGERFDAIYALATPEIQNNKTIAYYVDRNSIEQATAEGQMFKDFTIEKGNLDGSSVSLSDYVGKGKYVLVDFWAQWCGPCKAEIPNIKEIYKQFKGPHFEVLSVAVWDTRDLTEQAIKDLQLPWPQIVDAGTIPTELYGISGIPHLILFGPDGTIIARGLREQALKDKIAQVLKKNP